jgi:hypothetical protein
MKDVKLCKNTARTSKLSIISLILALATIPLILCCYFIFIIGFVNHPVLENLYGLISHLCLFLSVGGFLFGVSGIIRISLSKGQSRGYEFAMGGTIISFVFFIIYLFIVIVYGFRNA